MKAEDGGGSDDRFVVSKDLQQQSKAFDKLTDRVEYRQLVSSHTQSAMASITASAEAEKNAERLRENVRINVPEVFHTEVRACTTPTTKPRWTRDEDFLLISGWSNTSKDPITGADQTGVGFWKKVTRHYNAHVASIGGHPRTNSQCKDHWNKGNRLVTYFAGCYKRVVDLNRSGWSDANYLVEALSLFKQEKNKDFALIHWWEKVKNEPKWNAEYMQQNSLKRTKVSESGAYTSPPNLDGSEGSVNRSRPIEQNATKKKGKAKEVKKNKLQSEFLALESKRLAILERIAISNAKIAAAKEAKVEVLKFQAESQNFNKAVDILAKDTSHMSEKQLIHHYELCNLLKKKYFSK